MVVDTDYLITEILFTSINTFLTLHVV